MKKFNDSFPRTCWKPLAAWTNSFDDGKRDGQRNLLILLGTCVAALFRYGSKTLRNFAKLKGKPQRTTLHD